MKYFEIRYSAKRNTRFSCELNLITHQRLTNDVDFCKRNKKNLKKMEKLKKIKLCR